MSPRQLAVGWVDDVDIAPAALPDTLRLDLAALAQAPTPEAALRAELRRQLQSAQQQGVPVYVAFSGGRDSSLVLALAADVARREGCPPPVPLTLRYPADPDADEASWQQLVADHLRLEITYVDVETGGSDIISPAAMEVLERHGVCWPPGMVVRLPVYASAAGGILLTGEGGDEVLGSRRLTPLAFTVRTRRPPRGPLLAAVADALATSGHRRRALEREARAEPDESPWIREPLRSTFAARQRASAARQPWTHAAGTANLINSRSARLGMHHQALLAADNGVILAHPLLAPGFGLALARYGGIIGRAWCSRTDMMRLLAGELLPEAVLTRISKATFNHAAVNVHALAFARRWDGTGLDERLTDPAALKAEWLSEFPSARTLGLMQAARLAETSA